jgi:hypothetical protein
VGARTPSALADVVAGTFVDKPEDRLTLLSELSVGKRIEVLHDHLAQVLLDLAVRERSSSSSEDEEYLH